MRIFQRIALLTLSLLLLLTGCNSAPAGDSATEPTDAPTTPVEQLEKQVFEGEFSLDFGWPMVVKRGMLGDNSWGNWQFPALYYNPEGQIVAEFWHGADSILETRVPMYMFSTDQGNTWVSSDEYSTVSRENLMPNGKYFAGFVRKGAHTVTYLSDITPASEWNEGKYAYKTYFAEDLPKNEDTTVYAQEYDAATGEYTTFEVTVNWPYMPITLHKDNLLYPVTQVFAQNNRAVTTIDGELYICIYTRGFDATAASREEAVNSASNQDSVYVFKSSDNGRTWDLISQVLASTGGVKRFQEPEMEVMPDGSVIMVMRTGANNPSYIVRSTDKCKTWSEPEKFDDIGVLPQLLTLPCGVTLSTYGRPTMRVRATSDPAGLEWEKPMTFALTTDEGNSSSCHYTDLLPLDEYSALWIYSDFRYPNEDGKEVKTILTRVITVVPDPAFS